MQIEVLFFGITRDIVGENSLNFTLSEGSSVEELKQQLSKNYPDLTAYNYTIAVNEAYAELTNILQEKDTVALIPPVSGG